MDLMINFTVLHGALFDQLSHVCAV